MPVKRPSGGAGPKLSFITGEPPFITANVPAAPRRYDIRVSVTSIHHIHVAAVTSDPKNGLMLAQSVLALSLVVRIYDAYGIPADHLARARMTVDAVMKNAGIAITWPQCPCQSRVGAGELVVRIVTSAPASEPESLGFSYVDVDRKAGTLATVFGGRVSQLAAAAGTDDAELLGRAMAHEISHLLLGTREHEHHGLMRGHWTSLELAEQRPSDWILSRAESLRIREAIARRSIQSLPAIVTVDADPVPDVSAQ